MAVPRNRLSNSRKNKRRSHMAKDKRHVSVCKNCDSEKLSHRICDVCGYYKGRQVITISKE